MDRRAPRPHLRAGCLANSRLPYLSSPLLLPLLLLLAAACHAACPLPTITTQPQSQAVCSGGSVSFSISAFSAGCTVSYQWYGPQGLISGATGTNYTISPVNIGNAGNYYAVASVIGSSRQSSNATLTVLGPGAVQFSAAGYSVLKTTSVASIMVARTGGSCGAGSVNYTTANGTATAGIDYSATSGTLVFSDGVTMLSLLVPVLNNPAHTGDKYFTVSLSGASWVSLGSPPLATVTILDPVPAITTQPQDLTAAVGYPATFTVMATGTAPLSYQWQKGSAAIGGASNASYTVASVQAQDAGAYSVVVSNSYGSVASSNAVLTVTLPYTFSTIAGLAGVSGTNDGAGGAARFNNPSGVAVDNAGNLYVTDNGNQTIRKLAQVGTNWVVSTLAGLAGSLGTNDGTGSAARFDLPDGIAVDNTGSLYVADGQNFTIRKITSGGFVSTLAGLALNAGTNDGIGSTARFTFPMGVGLNNGSNIYVADGFNFTIRKIAPGAIVSTLAGLAGNIGSADGLGSAARFNYPKIGRASCRERV